MTVDNDIARERYRSMQRLARDLGHPTDEQEVVTAVSPKMWELQERAYVCQNRVAGGLTFAPAESACDCHNLDRSIELERTVVFRSVD